ncbi:DUF7139 domain-containing protein [Halovivax limisalsi]|uniref:DUF7139 domain-containing protein n=1 Tax=Halovivax limisalsi TaxID=1453760 RepID=UPI001FFD8D34|nr:permease [Halovivax limisalsi]
MSPIPEDKLFELYRRYIGEPNSDRDVYVGFGLFLCGLVLAVVALVLFVWGGTFEVDSDPYIKWVQPAYAMGMLALPVVMLGIVVLLPSERRVLAVSAAGVGITAIGVAGFLYSYPDNWNGYGADYTVQVVAVYAVGLAGIAASTGAALIAHYLDLARQIEPAGPAEEEDKEQYTDEEIAADIDSAMEDVELSWGGVEKRETSRLTFTDDEFDEANVGSMGVTKTRSSGVQQQVAGLKGLKGGEAKTATAPGTVDDQTQKLKELREKKRAEELATRNAGPLDTVKHRASGLVNRLKGRVSAVRNRVKRN